LQFWQSQKRSLDSSMISFNFLTHYQTDRHSHFMLAKTALCNALHNKKAMYNDSELHFLQF